VPINSKKIEGLKMNGKAARRGRNRGPLMDDLYRQLSIYYAEKHHKLLVLSIIRTLPMQRRSVQKVVHGVSTPPVPDTEVRPRSVHLGRASSRANTGPSTLPGRHYIYVMHNSVWGETKETVSELESELQSHAEGKLQASRANREGQVIVTVHA
jgi:hypothetical protein